MPVEIGIKIVYFPELTLPFIFYEKKKKKANAPVNDVTVENVFQLAVKC